MSWQQIRLFVPSSQAEQLSDALMEVGALSATIEDAQAGTPEEQPIFGEPGEPLAQMWENSVIVALFEQHAHVAAAVVAAAQLCHIAPVPTWQHEELAEQDWVRATQAQFDPIKISSRLWITPSWHNAPDPSAINLVLDPGLAFGTGSHPTTRLCLEWLDTHIQGGEHVLDYGCGSGILAIAALRLGAAQAWGVDIDPQALRASQDNAQSNHVNAEFYLPDALPPRTADIVVANILANPLRLLGSLLATQVRTGGHIVLSGVLDQQADEISQIYQQWFDMNAPVFSDGWCCLSGQRR